MTTTYAEGRTQIDAIKAQIDRITYRLQQGAIPAELAATRLRELADQIEVLG